MKKLMRIALVLFALVMFTGCMSVQPGKKSIGIAWRADLDSEFYTNVARAIEAAGAQPVLLAQVKSTKLNYVDGKVDPKLINENDILVLDMAKNMLAGGHAASNAEEAVANVSAVVFTGGEDICPTLYAKPVPWHAIADEKDYNVTRDVSDYLLMSYCLDKDIPILGICRGAQMLGVISGGTVIQDIPTFFANAGKKYNFDHRNQKATPQSYRDYASHIVKLADAKSAFAAISNGKDVAGCPSWHHQAVASVDGTALKVTGTTPVCGVDMIEVIERTDKSFAVGIQFHPEAVIVKHLDNAANKGNYMSFDQAVEFFKALIDAAK